MQAGHLRVRADARSPRPRGAGFLLACATLAPVACAPARAPRAPSTIAGDARDGHLALTLRCGEGAHFSDGAPIAVTLVAEGATLPRAALTEDDARAPEAHTRTFGASYTLHPGAWRASVRAHAVYFCCTESTCTRETAARTLPLLPDGAAP